MNQRILVVIGTPIAASFNHALAHSYLDAARDAGADIRVIDLATDPIPAHPTTRNELRAPRSADDLQLESDVARYIDDVHWAEHIVFFYPQWWGSYPAAMKAWIDRVILSGSAFKYRDGSIPERLLTGRTARIFMTMDSPTFWNRFAYRDGAVILLGRAVLGYTGVKTVGVTRFERVRFSDEAKRSTWLKKASALGAKDASHR